ncbi:hypothetical protein Q8G44_27860, partial [Klebsiella pneumoniae]
FSSLSFSSQIYQKPNSLSLSFAKPVSLSHARKSSPLVAAAHAVADESETDDIKKVVKVKLPGGFAAQTIFGTGRRKSAIARVVLKEGNGKVI